MSATDQPKSVVSGFTGPEMDAAAQARWPKDGQMLERNAFREGAYWAAEALAAAPLPQGEGGIREAAQAVVDRWDSPLWKDVEPTAHVIARLRQALTQPAPAPQGEDGWITHDGGPNPVPGQITETRHRGGSEYIHQDAWLSDQWGDYPGFWVHDGTFSDIIAYRIAAARSLPDSLATMEKVDG